jgi:hypothetical protein
MDGILQTKGQAFAGVETQSFTQILEGLFAILGWLMARCSQAHRRLRWSSDYFLGLPGSNNLGPRRRLARRFRW